MTPEEKARIKIDQWFADAGWKVVNREDYEPTCTAVAIREGLLKGNLEADYFLFINGKAVGVLEAKREETDAFASIVEKARVIDPLGHAGLPPLGKIRLTLAGEIKMTPVEASAGEFFCSFGDPSPGTAGVYLKTLQI